MDKPQNSPRSDTKSKIELNDSGSAQNGEGTTRLVARQAVRGYFVLDIEEATAFEVEDISWEDKVLIKKDLS